MVLSWAAETHPAQYGAQSRTAINRIQGKTSSLPANLHTQPRSMQRGYATLCHHMDTNAILRLLNGYNLGAIVKMLTFPSVKR